VSMTTYTLSSDVFIVKYQLASKHDSDSDSDDATDDYDYANLCDCEPELTERLNFAVVTSMHHYDPQTEQRGFARDIPIGHVLNGVVSKIWVELSEDCAKTLCHAGRNLTDYELTELIRFVDVQLKKWSSTFKDVPFYKCKYYQYFAYFDVVQFWDDKKKKAQEASTRKRKTRK
jgi:hypothetical protein